MIERSWRFKSSPGHHSRIFLIFKSLLISCFDVIRPWFHNGRFYLEKSSRVLVYNSTGQWFIAVMLFHGMMNFTGELPGISSDMYPILLSGFAVLALLLLIFWSKDRLVEQS